MFVISPRIVDLDQEMLARFQATRLRDITEFEQMQDDADASDEEKERRNLERKDARERRHEKMEDVLERRKVEIEHGREMRQFDRRRLKRKLSEDVKEWKAEEARAKSEEEGLNADGE
jgi:hypothetical protein